MIDIPNGEINAEWFVNAPTKPWVRVEFLRDFYTLATPDAYPFLLKSLTCSLRNQCEMICVIGVNSCNMSLFESYSKLVGLPFFAFSRLFKTSNTECIHEF